jgi:hypothetical protein
MSNLKTIKEISDFQKSLHSTYKQHPILNSILSDLENIKEYQFNDFRQRYTELLRSDFVQWALNKELNAFIDEEYYQLPLYFDSGRAKGWVVLNTPYFRFTTFFYDERLINKNRASNIDEQFSIQIAAPDSILYFPKGKGTVVNVYEGDRISAHSEAPQSLRLKESIDVQDGQLIHIEAGKHAFQFETVANDVVYHEISSIKSPVRVIGEYNLSSLQLVGLSAANLSSSRAEMFSEMVANLKHQPSIPVLEKLTRHQDHFVRWSAATSLYSLSPSRGQKVIESLTDDPHPDVRETAQKCISIFAGEHHGN